MSSLLLTKTIFTKLIKSNQTLLSPKDWTSTRAWRRSSITKVSAQPIQGKHLWRQFLFSVSFSSLAFGAAAYVQPDSDLPRDVFTAQGEDRKSRRLKEGIKFSLIIGALNGLVFVGWRVRGLRSLLTKYFMLRPTAHPLYSPLVLSTFSHQSTLHLAFNMIALTSFSVTSGYALGEEQLAALYLSSGVFGSFCSLANKFRLGLALPSIGASGAVLGVFAASCLLFPDNKVFIIFLPFFTFSSLTALKATLTLDSLGFLLKWQVVDHAAHLGGLLFGLVYISLAAKYYREANRRLRDK